MRITFRSNIINMQSIDSSGMSSRFKLCRWWYFVLVTGVAILLHEVLENILAVMVIAINALVSVVDQYTIFSDGTTARVARTERGTKYFVRGYYVAVPILYPASRLSWHGELGNLSQYRQLSGSVEAASSQLDFAILGATASPPSISGLLTRSG